MEKPQRAGTALASQGGSTPLQAEHERLKALLGVDSTQLRTISDGFAHELEVGLSNEKGDIPMNPTWATKLPSGTEKGRYLTMDMGGTNFRVCQVTLHGSGKFDVVATESKITTGLKNGTAEQLWHYVADNLQNFIDKHGISKEELATIPLAFTFSYPVTQTSITDGILQTWTKGFNISGVEGHDVVSQLQKVLDERDLPVRIVALVNDTVGTLMASRYVDAETEIGSIFGTGSNAAYMERCSQIPKLADHRFPDDALISINCEYGAFDNSTRVLPFTDYDIQIDRESPRPGEQRYEKMVAGLYLGEIFRHILLDLYKSKELLFHGQEVARLAEPYSIDSSFLSRLENDESPDLQISRNLFEEELSITPTLPEVEFCKALAQLIAERSARLYACGIAAIMKKRSLERCHVAVDGSVFNKYPDFPQRVLGALREIFGWRGDLPEPVRIVPAVDGSSVGAAVIAALVVE
ncbi:hexokinase [Aspergillus karnatakaensis]|uniref:putative hexokinase n=1 Tax=Aspergillus karnatakaensis TaxID=1810916 RepID=UPI003CCDBEB2